MQLRPYQSDAVAAVYRDLRARNDNLCVVIPTAGGKTPIIATICRDAVTLWGGRVLIVSHVKELLEQAADKLRAIAPDVRFGVYSAGLRSRDTGGSVTIAGVQSVYRRACDLGAYDLILVDEAHLIPPDGDGMYQTLISDMRVINQRVRVIGFTATPFRTNSGHICSADGLLNHVSYEIGVRELIALGYLCPLVSKAGAGRIDLSGLHVRGGEYVAEEVESLMDRAALVDSACREIVARTNDRRSVLIFAAGVQHANHVADTLRDSHGLIVGRVFGDTPPMERAGTLEQFRAGGLKYLVNVNVLTTGFDAPNIDCVVLLRPFCSPVLYVQTAGRGFRLHPGKANCLVLDFGSNVVRHGPIDDVRMGRARGSSSGDAPAKACPQCASVVSAGYSLCPDCGFEFPPPERKQHGAKAGTDAILSGEVTLTEYDVLAVEYSAHKKRGADDTAPRTLRVDYQVGLAKWVSEWVCVEHVGYAGDKAAKWWAERSREQMPCDSDEAAYVAQSGALAATKRITVKSVSGEKYDRVVKWELGPIPDARGSHDDIRDVRGVPAITDEAIEIPF